VLKDILLWRAPLRIAGPRPVAQVTAALGAHLAQTRFGVGERMVGRLEGNRVRVWRKSVASFAGDVVEFEGAVHVEGSGSIIEGTMQYKLAAKVQFVGLLAIGALLALAGTLRYFAGGEAEARAFGFGMLIFVSTLIWVYSSSRMRGDQVGYLERRLREFVAA
jgi:hypothetical protein